MISIASALPGSVLHYARRRQLLTAAIGALALVASQATSAQRGEVITFEVQMAHRKLASAESVLRVQQGAEIVLNFRSDQQLELHLHGYDRLVRLRAGEVTTLRFAAIVTGRFPIEVHDIGPPGAKGDGKGGHRTLAYLEVHPR